ncbi:Phosphatidylinositol N-acetylglucosaminyltransferase gpi3 subunit [Ogataea parapolymorpha DL-1]|uniref:Phosphatidylinositol N-acetylglucosaminyltransferase GPI3 subunit n=1 Tax=Ogataea parapolymorpha (strain ATCC 26012 / BCRC 20466 / JCM 22074 / NRRL Y-7560 / DL-1) TaxID=871575 RepID=W1Q941_OGAPD|nr:Phosphatidylinositol N-acetylglucosaminyltransferase gpi3 subunit [Ogataea parapolymorpha DL-1]ESW97326.1 Phosphatidylinositol N-acetylglucosaminyltransferase gpi3 subunit [Ogataea parapolymorpha DL-1]
MKSYNIAMISDFFYPQPGGMELHIYHLSQKLIARGHSVVVITHAYDDRTGVRMLTNGLKIYYVPFFIIYRQTTFPTVFSLFPILRQILIRERIDIVHGHGTFSSMCHEAILHANTMGIKTVFTDHSLFGFADVGSILGNKLLKFTLTNIGHVICVSHTCKENTVLRASLDPSSVSVIPNAVIADDFKPAEVKPSLNKITVVVISRLFQNKGADLLTAIIPRLCSSRPDIHFLIAGDGPKFIDLEQMREKHQLQDRVELIGSIRHQQVRDVMVQGHIYLHPSLTEAFGTVLVEAASCGLLVVTTKVGGIPEVLPNKMTVFADPDEESLVDAVNLAVRKLKENKIDTSSFHEEVKKMYDWGDIAKRTEKVYNMVSEREAASLVDVLIKYYNCGPWAGLLFILCVVVDLFILEFLNWWWPESDIDKVKKWPRKKVQTGK